MLVKLFGRPREESQAFGGRAAKVRDIGVVQAMYGQVFFVALTLLASLVTALVYGLGGVLVINGTFQLGTLVALTALLGRVYGPITSLSNVQINVMTALVSFDRVFEVLDLKPLIADRPDAEVLPARSPATAGMRSRRPSSSTMCRSAIRRRATCRWPRWSRSPCPCPSARHSAVGVLHDVSFHAPSGQLTALVGPSGRGQDHHHRPGRAAV